jgi:hypothetical protein
VAPRTRILAYGTAALLTVAGMLCAAFIGGVVGPALAAGLLSIGLGGAVLLVFLEVGLSEDEERERDERRRARKPPHEDTGGRAWRRPPRRPG